MTVAFTDADYLGFTYELSDTEIINDVLIILGASGSETLVRGYDTGSISKYGPRSHRIDRPIVEGSTTATAQATAILDRNIEPYAIVDITVQSKDDTLTAIILALEISDLVTITETTCGLSSVYFIVESIDLDIDEGGFTVASLHLVKARVSEHP